MQVAVEVKFEAEIFALVRPSGRGDLVKRGLRKPEFLIVDGGTGLEQALAALWGDVPTQRCTVHKHRNLLAHAPQRLQEEVSADYNDMIYATCSEIEARRRAFIGKWRLKCKAVADSLEEAGDRLFTFTRLPVQIPTQIATAPSASFSHQTSTVTSASRHSALR